MSKLTVELGPETGICSILKEGAGKVDLVPDEVAAIREAAGDAEKIRAVLAEAESDFAAALASEDLGEIGSKLS